MLILIFIYKSNAKISVSGKPLCRYCRLKKCVRIGMKLENGEIKNKSDGEKEETNVVLTSTPLSRPKNFAGIRDAVYAIYQVSR